MGARILMMSSDTHLALGERWDDQPQVWRNFVTVVVKEHDLHPVQSNQIWKTIDTYLAQYDLRMGLDGSRKCVVGKPEDLTAWMLAYS